MLEIWKKKNFKSFILEYFNTKFCKVKSKIWCVFVSMKFKNHDVANELAKALVKNQHVD